MSFSYINVKHMKSKPQMWICKPDLNHTPILKLTDVYNGKLRWKLGALNELTFDAPLYVERNHQKVENPLIEKFDGLYHVKVVYNRVIEYFVMVKKELTFGNDGHQYSYTMHSLGYLLNNKIVQLYEEESKTLEQHLALILKQADANSPNLQTDWTFEVLDQSINLPRAFEASESTVLEALYGLAEKYRAIIQWDTLNQVVRFHKPENIGINKGMLFKEDNFLESYNVEFDFDSIVTRLYVYGQDGLEFRRLSPTGMNYIESLDWFIHPFEQDSTGKVISHSKYLEDETCINIRRYEKAIKDNEGIFGELVNQKTSKQDEKEQREHELTDIESELRQVENELWVVNKTKNDMIAENSLYSIEFGTDKYSPQQIAAYESDRIDAVNRKTAIEARIESKKSQIQQIENAIVDIDTQVIVLRETLQIERFLTARQLREINKFIRHSKHNNDSITDDEDLLEEGLEVFKRINIPPIKLSMSVVNFLNDIKFEPLKDRIALGDTVRLKSKVTNTYIESKIIEVALDFNSQSIDLVIANEKDLSDEYSDLMNRIYSISNTSSTVDMNKIKNKGDEVASIVDDILNKEYEAAKQAILAGYMDLTVLDRFGLRSYEYNNSDTYLFINNGLLGITSTNLNTIEVAISKRGIHAEKIVGKLVLSKKLMVTDELGTVEIMSGTISIYNENDKLVARLGKYQLPNNPSVTKTGLYLPDGSFDIRTTENNNRGVQIDIDGIRAFNNNGVRTFDVSSASGLVSIIGSMNIKSHPDTQRGVEIDGNGIRIYNDSGILMFQADHYGNIFFKGKLDGAYGWVKDLTGSIEDMTGSVKDLTGSIHNMDGTFDGKLTSKSMNTIELDAEQIKTGKLKADLIDTQSLTAATIDVDQLRANGAQITDLSAITSNLGEITGGSITIDTDMKIGNNLYIGDSSDWMSEKSIIFAGSSGITYHSDVLSLTAIGIVRLEAGQVEVIANAFTVNGVPIG